jgi:hypothetical protein
MSKLVVGWLVAGALAVGLLASARSPDEVRHPEHARAASPHPTPAAPSLAVAPAVPSSEPRRDPPPASPLAPPPANAALAVHDRWAERAAQAASRARAELQLSADDARRLLALQSDAHELQKRVRADLAAGRIDRAQAGALLRTRSHRLARELTELVGADRAARYFAILREVRREDHAQLGA